MKSVEELIIENDPGWPIVAEWINTAKNKIEVLPVDVVKAKDALYKTQVTSRSPMGAIIFQSGGIFIDNGWIRILGSGSEKLTRSLPDWNLGKAHRTLEEPVNFLLIADDVIGGFYILNFGAFGNDLGKVYYFSPDSLEYEPLNLSYSDFLMFCFNGDLQKFYGDYRWKTWKADILKLQGDQVFNFYPYLWTKEGKNINKNSRKEISVEEQYNFNLNMKNQLEKQ